MNTIKPTGRDDTIKMIKEACEKNRRMMEDKEYCKKIEAELHYTVDSPAVQKLREELKVLRGQREQQEVAADGGA
ncbi:MULTISPECIES: hypothetical protein [Eikenella]|uniref:Uncharacterized protein n=1 Tax=Eikenella exigua TaxID=2528037 RepID=A0AAX1FA80_9NEIS|nr:MULTISPECIES: hypothetical protein [Eikenella]OAM26541.1 hypothetical protein A7P94_07585 [Eikenella sp. NML01-A-086]QED92995.1 hypothetical protein EZJ17_10040 [Eikenella exigua]